MPHPSHPCLKNVQELAALFLGYIRPVLTLARSCRNCGGKVITPRKTETAIEDGRKYQSPEKEFQWRWASVLYSDFQRRFHARAVGGLGVA